MKITIPKALQTIDATQQPLAVSVKQCALLVGLSERNIWKIIKSGRLHVCRCGCRVIVPMKSIEAFLNGTNHADSTDTKEVSK